MGRQKILNKIDNVLMQLRQSLLKEEDNKERDENEQHDACTFLLGCIRGLEVARKLFE